MTANNAILCLAIVGAILSFANMMLDLPLVEDYDDTEYPNEEDE